MTEVLFKTAADKRGIRIIDFELMENQGYSAISGYLNIGNLIGRYYSKTT